jgi:NAD(P)-dependent dehydrogenase (short-subunit alcohol dehydrogenase family)
MVGGCGAEMRRMSYRTAKTIAQGASARVAPVLLVTGGSRGIGRETCVLAAQQNYTVVVNYLENHQSADDVISTIQGDGGTAYKFQADVGDPNQVEALFEFVDIELGRLDALVNNAGANGHRVKALDVSYARLKRVWASNVDGAFLCSQQAARRMLKATDCARGCIVNVSSISVRSGGADYHVDYAAAKAAVEAMTIGFARELGPQGIRVNAVCPGTIATDMSAGLVGEDRRAREKRIPARRLGRPEEVARAILWLLSDEATYVSGAILAVAGGS